MAKTSTSLTGAPTDPRERIVEATMALAAERDWNEIELTDIAARAEVSLLQLRDAFPSKGAILGGFARLIDRKVLGDSADDLAGEPAKERLFDVLMRRLDALAPYKAALRRLKPAVMRDPVTAMALNSVAVNSHRYMLAAANIPTSGPLGALRTQGLAIGFARVVDIWLRDDDPDQSRTMAELDRVLTRGGQMLDRAEDVMRLTAPFRAFGDGVRRARKDFCERSRRHKPRHDAAGDSDGYRDRDDPVAV
ncbi:MAG: TetR/AcrR family transcriptional regulator [Beijerinckiaceae bacterium]